VLDGFVLVVGQSEIAAMSDGREQFVGRIGAEGVIRRFSLATARSSPFAPARRSFDVSRKIAQGTLALEPIAADYAHRAAPRADPLGSNPPYRPFDFVERLQGCARRANQ
jgi:hypothetical protein